MLQPPVDRDLLRTQQDDARPGGQGGHREALRRHRRGDLVAVQVVLAPVDGAHQGTGAGGALMLAGALVRAPAGAQPVLRLREGLLETDVLGPLLLVLLLPAHQFGLAALR
ncbi:hypothetical protein SAFG77S_04918 [Streptomyces afghaniensis]